MTAYLAALTLFALLAATATAHVWSLAEPVFAAVSG